MALNNIVTILNLFTCVLALGVSIITTNNQILVGILFFAFVLCLIEFFLNLKINKQLQEEKEKLEKTLEKVPRYKVIETMNIEIPDEYLSDK